MTSSTAAAGKRSATPTSTAVTQPLHSAGTGRVRIDDVSRPTILVVEDEPSIRRGLCDVLVYRGFEAVEAADGPSGLAEALSGRHALVVLDVMLPGMDGLTICERVRAALPRQAILMLTARGAESDVLEGFARGADDYVPKPFSVAQLMARVTALLRRTAPANDERLHVGALHIDASTLLASGPEGTAELSLRDVEVIRFLNRKAGAIATRTDLLREVWGYERAELLETRCVDMHIVKLRRKLQTTGADPIETVRGAGYRLSPR